MPLYTLITQDGALSRDAKAKLAMGTDAPAFRICGCAEKLGACRVSGLCTGPRIHRRRTGGNCRAHAFDAYREVTEYKRGLWGRQANQGYGACWTSLARNSASP
jgi:hypothetical protein